MENSHAEKHGKDIRTYEACFGVINSLDLFREKDREEKSSKKTNPMDCRPVLISCRSSFSMNSIAPLLGS